MPDLVGRTAPAIATHTRDPMEGRVRVAAALSRAISHRRALGPAMTAFAAGESIAASLMRPAEPEPGSEVSLWDGSRISFSRIAHDAIPEPV